MPRTTTYDEPSAPAGTPGSRQGGAALGPTARPFDDERHPAVPALPAHPAVPALPAHPAVPALPAHPAASALTAAVDLAVAAVESARAGRTGRPGATSAGAISSGADAAGLLLTLLAQAGRLTAAAASLSTFVDADGLWALDGSRSFAGWLAANAAMPYHKARDLVATGRALRDHLPATEAAAWAGEVSADQVVALAKLAPTTEARRQALAAPTEECGEGFLLEHARAMPADPFRNLVKRWAAAVDPDADERGYRDAQDREFVSLAQTTDGYHLSGFLTTEHGATFDTALSALMGPPAPCDMRSTQQRRAQAVNDLSRLVLDQGLAGTGAATRPHLNVVVDYDTLRRTLGQAGIGNGAALARLADESDCTVGTIAGPGSALFRLGPVADVERFAVGEIVGTGPIPPSVLARLACDSEISRIVFGPDSQAINVGRAERTFNGPRRRAIVARDQTCRYPGCNAPPALGELHHVTWWSRNGDTDVNDGILLCWHHHDVVHAFGITITRAPTGGWVFTTRHGDVVTARGGRDRSG